jgi:hypothetical protein
MRKVIALAFTLLAANVSTRTFAQNMLIDGRLDVGGNAKVNGIIEQEPWHLASYTPGNGWVDFGAPYAQVAYFKDTMGIVHLRGMAKSGTCGTTIFTLPTGYLPEATLQYSVMLVGNVLGLVSLESTGVVKVTTGCTTPSAGVRLDGITFRAAG